MRRRRKPPCGRHVLRSDKIGYAGATKVNAFVSSGTYRLTATMSDEANVESEDMSLCSPADDLQTKECAKVRRPTSSVPLCYLEQLSLIGNFRHVIPIIHRLEFPGGQTTRNLSSTIAHLRKLYRPLGRIFWITSNVMQGPEIQ